MNRTIHAATSLLMAFSMAFVAMQATAATTTSDSPTKKTEVQRGHYLAVAGDCAACHTAPEGKPYAGGLPVATPIGSIFSTNITPSKTGGIGNDSLQQFSNALRKGIGANGEHLYPAMPYTSYAQLTDADVRALYAYFMHGVKPVDSKPPPTNLPFPFNIRASMGVWDMLFLDNKPFTPDTSKSAQWNRGAYLVKGLAHCSTCHTPRNVMMAEKSSQFLAGASLGTWFAPNITSDAKSGIGDWSVPQIVDYLKHGHAQGRAQAAGPMAEAVDHSLRHLSDADLKAIAVFLKTVPAHHDAADTRAVTDWGKPYADLASIRGKPLPKDPNAMTGPQLYDANCATCHEDRGQGSFDGKLPSLFHNSATGRSNPDNLVMVILHGIAWRTDGSGMHMPGFAQKLSDQQVATLSNYLTKHFGNPAATVTPDHVATLRAGGATSNLVLIARIVMAVVAIIIILIIIAIVWAIRRRLRREPSHTHS